jgi:hypothetical protein
MQPPRKVVITGDKKAGLALRGTADSQLRILEKQMSHQGLKQGWRTIHPYPGAIIQVWSCFNQRQVEIYVKPHGGKRGDRERSCYCIGCVAFGQVMAVHDITFLEDMPETLCYDKVDQYPALLNRFFCSYPLYDVEVCNSQIYVLFENIPAIDNTPYCVGDRILVMPQPDPIQEDSLATVESFCLSTCGETCFLTGPIISVAILQIDASNIIPWVEDGYQ